MLFTELRLIQDPAAKRNNVSNPSENDFPSFSIERYRFLVEEAQDIIFETDMEGYFTFVNKRGEEILGYPKSKILSMKFADLINPEYKDSVRKYYRQQVVDNQESSYLEFPAITHSGEEVWLGQNVQLLYKGKEVRGSMAVARVITEKYQEDLLRKQSEEKYRSIIQNLQFGLIEVDLQERIVFINDAMCKIIGFTKDELLGKVASEVLVKEETRKLIENQHELRKKKQSSVYEAEIIRKDGTPIYALISGAPTFDSKGNRIGSIGIHVDISERKKGELELQVIKEKLDEYTKGLENLNEIISDNHLNTDQQLEFGLKIVSEYFGLPIGGIVKAEGENLRVVKNLENSQVPEEYNHTLPLNGSVAGISYLQNKLIIIPNISLSEYKDLETIQSMKIKSLLSMPIQLEDRVYGSIILGSYTAREDEFSSYDIEFFRLFSRFVGYLLSTQKLERTIERYNSGLVRLNEISSNSKLSIEEQLKEGLKVITEYLNFQKGGILLASGEDLLIIATVLDSPLPEGLEQKIPIKDTPSGISFSENRLIAIKDVSNSEFRNTPFMESFGLLSCIFIPIEIEGVPAGVIALGNEKIKEEDFTQNDLEFFRLFSLRVGYLIANQQNQEKLRKEQENLKSINEELDKNQQFLSSLNEFVTSLLDKEDIYSISWEITENIIEKFGFSDCVIYVLNEESGYLEQIAAYGKNKAKSRQILNPIQIQFGSGIVGAAAQSGKVVIIPDIREDPRYIADDEVRLSEISVPIIADGKVIGVIDSEHHELNFFTQEHSKTLATIANLTANRLKNAKAKRRQEKAEGELRASENKLRAVINAAMDAIITINEKGIITEWNPRATEIFGWNTEDVIGSKLTDNIIPDQHRKSHDKGMNHYMATGVGPALNQRFEITALHKKGHEFPIELSIIPIIREESRSFTAFARDITLQKESRDKIQKALNREREVGELKSRFVAMTSHEFRTPLTTIKQNVDLINYMLETSDKNAKDKYGKFFDRINSEIGRVTALMNDVLLLGRIESGKVEIHKTSTDLQKLIEETIQKITLGRPEGRSVLFKVIGVNQPVQVDIQLMEQIMNNLISNALKYSDKTIDPEIVLSFESLSSVQIIIIDYGIGIPEKDQKNLFTTFYRATNVRNIPGTGLGLSIVKEFVLMHGGTIDLISDTNKGTAFIVKLPFS